MILTINNEFGQIEFNVYDEDQTYISHPGNLDQTRNVYYFKLDFKTRKATYKFPKILVEDYDEDDPKGFITDRFDPSYKETLTCTVRKLHRFLIDQYLVDRSFLILFCESDELYQSFLTLFSQVDEFRALIKARNYDDFEEIVSLYTSDKMSSEFLEYVMDHFPQVIIQTTKFELEFLADPNLQWTFLKGLVNLTFSHKNHEMILQHYRDFQEKDLVNKYFVKLYMCAETRLLALEEFNKNHNLLEKILLPLNF